MKKHNKIMRIYETLAKNRRSTNFEYFYDELHIDLHLTDIMSNSDIMKFRFLRPAENNESYNTDRQYSLSGYTIECPDKENFKLACKIMNKLISIYGDLNFTIYARDIIDILEVLNFGYGDYNSIISKFSTFNDMLKPIYAIYKNGNQLYAFIQAANNEEILEELEKRGCHDFIINNNYTIRNIKDTDSVNSYSYHHLQETIKNKFIPHKNEGIQEFSEIYKDYKV